MRGERVGGRRQRRRLAEGPRCRRRLRAGVAQKRGAPAVQMHLLLRAAVDERPHGARRAVFVLSPNILCSCLEANIPFRYS
jgi:hypothetical protein